MIRTAAIVLLTVSLAVPVLAAGPEDRFPNWIRKVDADTWTSTKDFHVTLNHLSRQFAGAAGVIELPPVVTSSYRFAHFANLARGEGWKGLNVSGKGRQVRLYIIRK